MKTNTKFRRAKRTFKRIAKGKVFGKSEFGTGLGDYTLYGLITQLKTHPEGVRPAPTKLVIAPEVAVDSPLDPVQIYIGTEPSQHRAERVLLWSIYKARNRERQYEIFLMKDLVGFSRVRWKTGFTGYRYAIPELAGYEGRAIYNDVDQIYLEDPGNLFDLPMENKAILALGSIDTSVMLMDCPALKGLWSIGAIADSPRERLHAAMIECLAPKDLTGDLPPNWNARDHEYISGKSSLLHFTILHTQPWQPFPSQIKYLKNKNAELWCEMENDANQHNFAPSWKVSADQSYDDMKDYFSHVS